MIYKEFKYIYPPRPEKTFPRNGMSSFDNGTFLAQPKYNGSCCEVYIGKDTWKVMNRHKKTLNSFKITKDEFQTIVTNDNLNVFVGEYLDKSKKNEKNEVFNHKYIIFDILVLNGKHLLGKTFQERFDILHKMFKFKSETEYCYQITDNIYLTKTFYKDFGVHWDKFVEIDMLEGIVLKRKNAGLELGTNEKNNTNSQLKCRKPTKNYNH